jgi:hypothetical protein
VGHGLPFVALCWGRGGLWRAGGGAVAGGGDGEWRGGAPAREGGRGRDLQLHGVEVELARGSVEAGASSVGELSVRVVRAAMVAAVQSSCARQGPAWPFYRRVRREERVGGGLETRHGSSRVVYRSAGEGSGRGGVVERAPGIGRRVAAGRLGEQDRGVARGRSRARRIGGAAAAAVCRASSAVVGLAGRGGRDSRGAWR